jgi:hypothetical protein
MNITLHAPQITILILLAFGIVLCTAKHGEERPPYNGLVALLDAIITIAILYWGNFFA